MRTSAISRGISKHLPEKLADCTLWTGICVRDAQNVWEGSWNQQVEPCLASCNRSEMFRWTTLTTKQQQCINIPLRASASTDVTVSSWPPPPFMKITWCWRQSGGKPGEDRNRRNSILWEGLLYVSMKLSICGSDYLYEKHKVSLALDGVILS